jgi:hypothetical protein
VADVKALAKTGLSDEVILSHIRNSHAVYHLTTAEIIDLKESGVSEKVIDFMINTGSHWLAGLATRQDAVVERQEFANRSLGMLQGRTEHFDHAGLLNFYHRQAAWGWEGRNVFAQLVLHRRAALCIRAAFESSGVAADR